MRGNPAGYVPYVEAYIEDQKTNGEFGNSIATARELIAELRQTPRLSILEPSECVYRAAKKHGQQQQKNGSIEHQGNDGSWPWDRVLRECKGFEDGNENLVGGFTDVRKSVIINYVTNAWLAREQLAFPDMPVKGLKPDRVVPSTGSEY